VQPFEQLRRIARHSSDDRSLLDEAAWCLAEFDDDPAGLVVTCRRLLHHHPASGPLWWLCARVLVAAEPSHAACEAQRLIRSDPTSARLASVLPFPHDDPVAVLGWPDLAGEALDSRPDLDVVLVDHERRRNLRQLVAQRGGSVRVTDVAETAALAPTHLLVEVAVMDPQDALVPFGTAEVVARTVRARTRLWLVAGVGRLLPSRLLGSMARLLGDLEDHGLERMPLGSVDRVAGPGGLDRPENLARRVDCPATPELLRFA
jgi:hypothetical protein